jgi:hypothetical protein
MMDEGSIYDAVRRRTRKAFGFAVNLHRFRHAALTVWSIHDPKNILGGFLGLRGASLCQINVPCAGALRENLPSDDCCNVA